MTSRRICVVACLLFILSGCDRKAADQAIASDKKAEKSVFDKPLPMIAKIPRFDDKKAKSLNTQVASLVDEVKGYRYRRLDRFAKREGWKVGATPEEAMGDPRMLKWWQEWKKLQAKEGPRK